MPHFPAGLGGDYAFNPLVNEGATNEDSEGLLRKHLNPALVGDAWDALIAAMATGDAKNVEAAKLAFDQLFKISASGLYLDRKAADDGLQRPANVGMPDDLFRQYAIRTAINQLTEESLLEILEVFYGSNSVRAYADTVNAQPFALSDGDDLSLIIDGNQLVVAVFTDEDFAITAEATAAEVAAAITRVLRLNGVQAYALPVVDPQDNSVRVRIYSGALGLGSSIQVIAGSAQPWLQFPQKVAAQVTTHPTWTLTYDAVNSRLRFAPDSNFDVSLVQVGDYVAVYGAGFQAVNRGSFEIVDTFWAYPDGSTLEQWFEVVNLDGVAQGSVIQGPEEDLMIFRPLRQTTHASKEREVVVAVPGAFVDVILPATSVAVGRGPLTAAYAQLNDSVTASLERVAGLVTVVTDSPHGLTTGAQVQIDGAYPDYSLPGIDLGSGSLGAGLSETCQLSFWSTLTPAIGEVPYRPGAVVLRDGRALFAGGDEGDGGGGFSAVSEAMLFQVNSVTTLANGKIQVDYEWNAPASLPAARGYGAMSIGQQGTIQQDGALFTGGYDLAVAVKNTAYLYAGSADTWTAKATLNAARAAHGQVTIPGYGPFVFGGVNAAGTSLATTELYNAAANTWTTKTAMGTARTDPRAVVLSDGRVLVAGGRKMTAGNVYADYNSSTTTTLATSEIYDPVGNVWTASGPMSFARYYHQLVLLPDDRVLAIGGLGFNLTQPPFTDPLAPLPIEIWDPADGRWRPFSRLVFGGEVDAVYLPLRQQVLISSPPSNRFQILDLATMTCTMGAEAIADSFQVGSRLLAVGGHDLVVQAGGVDSGLVVTDVGYLYIPNDDRFAAGGLNGQFAVEEVLSGTSFTYRTETLTYTLSASTTLVTPVAAAASDVPGPFAFNPVDGLAVTGSTSTLSMALADGHQYATIEVADATQFPDEPGWLSFAAGYSYQVAPVKYLGRLSSTTLALDYKFRFTSDVPAGAEVCLLANKGAFIPTNPEELGAFYATASAAGRVAAGDAIDAAAGGGIEVNKTISYPGDRGLGGEGLPSVGVPKLSDKVGVWGSDDLDAEYAAAKED